MSCTSFKIELPKYTLFTRKDFQPIVFSLGRSDKRPWIERLVEEGGGVLELPAEVDTTGCRIDLVDKSSFKASLHDPTEDGDVFDLRFVVDSFTENALKPLSRYRLNSKSKFDFQSDSDLEKILIGIEKWSSFEPKMRKKIRRGSESGESCSSLEDLLSEKENTARQARSRKAVETLKGRAVYTKREKQDIIDYIVERKAYTSIKGNAIWQQMYRDEICHRRHTWQSLKEHFRKQIFPQLKMFNITAKQYMRFRRARLGLPDESESEGDLSGQEAEQNHPELEPETVPLSVPHPELENPEVTQSSNPTDDLHELAESFSKATENDGEGVAVASTQESTQSPSLLPKSPEVEKKKRKRARPIEHPQDEELPPKRSVIDLTEDLFESSPPDTLEKVLSAEHGVDDKENKAVHVNSTKLRNLIEEDEKLQAAVVVDVERLPESTLRKSLNREVEILNDLSRESVSQGPLRPEDDKKILQFIVDLNMEEDVFGKALYRLMILENVVGKRDFEELRDHTLKTILPNLSSFGLTKEQIQKFPLQQLESQRSVATVIDEENTTSDNESIIEEPPTQTFKLPRGRSYTRKEDEKILIFIAKNRRYSDVGGISLWKTMERRSIVQDRSFYSLKERFRKNLLKNLHRFSNILTPEEISLFKKYQKF